jgi:NDP-sugar pyrophosphorylase family protein
MDSFGPNGETILDYTIYDAIKAGFKKVVFVIRRSIEADFKKQFLDKLDGHLEVDYVFQELNKLPDGFSLPEGREKPWGTAHAVMMAQEKVNEAFAIVNADDFYGRASLITMYNQLSNLDKASLNACMVGFKLKNTLSDHGHVSRGICEKSADHHLKRITERTHILKGNGNIYYLEDGHENEFTGEEVVSMNLMGFTPPAFDVMTDLFTQFLQSSGNQLKSEFFIPDVLSEVLKLGVHVPVMTTDEQWFGVTYKEDKQIAKLRLENLINQGVYPAKLWAK